MPQNRERVFGISIRKDIDTGYVFPEPFELKIRLKDVLEKKVDEKFYLSDMVQQRFKITDKTFTKSIIGTTKPDFRTIGQRDLAYQQDSIMGALVATDYKQPKQILEPKEKFGRMGRQAVETYNEKQPNYGDTVNPFNKTVDSSNNCPTITTRPEGFKTAILPVTQDYRIRKLTPKECWRLMGFTDEQFQKAQDAGVSNSQLYKQAGNSIVVDVLYYIFRNLFTEKPKYRVQVDNEEQLLGQISILDFMN